MKNQRWEGISSGEDRPEFGESGSLACTSLALRRSELQLVAQELSDTKGFLK